MELVDNDLVWDDSLFITDCSGSQVLDKKEFAKYLADLKSKNICKSEPTEEEEESNMANDFDKPVYKVGSFVRATYTVDGFDYEAVILSIDTYSAICRVKYIGYGNEEDVKVSNLSPTWGKKAREKQMKIALNELTEEVNSEPENLLNTTKSVEPMNASLIENEKVESDLVNDVGNTTYTIGSHCRACYVNGLYYEAKIMKIDVESEMCHVKYVGYGNEKDVKLMYLLPSWGQKARNAQIQKALEENITLEDISSSDSPVKDTHEDKSTQSQQQGVGLIPETSAEECSELKEIDDECFLPIKDIGEDKSAQSIDLKPVTSSEQWSELNENKNTHSACDEERVIECAQEQKSAFSNAVGQSEYFVGCHVRAIYSDGIPYEADILAIDPESEMCHIKYVGYDNEEFIKIIFLLPSAGEKAREEQIKIALGQQIVDDPSNIRCQVTESASQTVPAEEEYSKESDKKDTDSGCDDNLLIEQKKKPMSDESVLESAQEEKSELSNKVYKPVYFVGCHVRAIYSDGIPYEADILAIDPESEECRIKYVGYDNEEVIKIIDILPSEGEQARKEQIKMAQAEQFVDETSNIISQETESEPPTSSVLPSEEDSSEQNNQKDTDSGCDENLLIEAYDSSVKLGKEDLAKLLAASKNTKPMSEESVLESTQEKESDLSNEVDQPVYFVGSHVRATYSDGITYEADILSIDPESEECLIKYVGYDNEEVIKIIDLRPSGGETAREEQMKIAVEEETSNIITQDTESEPLTSSVLPSVEDSAEQSYQKDTDSGCDENLLIDAYDSSVNLGKEDLAKLLATSKNTKPQSEESVLESTQEKESDLSTEVDQPVYFVGCHVRAIYSDGIPYEADILAINPESEECRIKYVGYDNEEVIKIKDILPSEGEQARKEQMKMALEEGTSNILSQETESEPPTSSVLPSGEDCTEQSDKINTDSGCDENLLIDAYEKSLDLGMEDISKNLETPQTSLSMHVESETKNTTEVVPELEEHEDKPAYTVGMPVRAIYDDGITYEADILSIDTDSETCLVRSLGYNKEEQKRIMDLLPSEGKMVRKEQVKALIRRLVKERVREKQKSECEESETATMSSLLPKTSTELYSEPNEVQSTFTVCEENLLIKSDENSLKSMSECSNVQEVESENDLDKPVYEAGSFVRATYAVDGIDYEAIILSIDAESGMCHIKYIGYGNEEDVKLKHLLPSWGEKARLNQIHMAMQENSCATSVDLKMAQRFYDFSNQLHQQPPTMPPMPPIPGTSDGESQHLHEMLKTWYMCGYFTGIYQAAKKN